MKKLVMAGFLLAGIFSSNAQTISLTSATPTSTTVGGSSSVRVGTGAGAALTTGANNVFIGTVTGGADTTGANNTFVGWAAGPNVSTGEYNTLIGRSAGAAQTTAFYNTFIGGLVGIKNTTGGQNTFLGFGAGAENITGGNNTITGWGAGGLFNAWGNTMYGTQAGNQAVGDGNTLIGQKAGFKAGSSNVMIGVNAGYNETGNNKLYIDVVADANVAAQAGNPLIWGDFSADQLKLQGKVGIGGNGTTGFGNFPTLAGSASVSNYNLFVKGGILSDEVRVALNSTWADYVFANDYELKPLSDLEAFIAKNKHLPNVPSANQVKEDGINVAEMARIQQEKIEELTLYIIAQNKRIEALEAKMNQK
ncbi:hypothetical protein G4D82_00450 [Flavobacterium sp. CYK-4]|uniref:hypothetical protein n=1 Tax=Flavobacterium lotistagni TaxID=2709660 RepID=UPI001407984F|nr:hypothetical protein [Flavobacterium lotistagni]NHM05678.1 hypothetical protein [Flavobacterium lotistagni]